MLKKSLLKFVPVERENLRQVKGAVIFPKGNHK
jgi:hypothetical protein